MSKGHEHDSERKGADSETPADEQGRGDRVIRDESGVIVGSRGAGPKILGVIELPKAKKGRGGAKGSGADARAKGKPGSAKGKGKGAKGRVEIVEPGSSDGPKGRASARKAREVRSVRRMPSRRAVRRSGKPSSAGTAEMSAEKKRIRVDETISIGDLARQMGVKAPKVIRVIWGMGIRNATVASSVDVETAELVAAEFGYRVEDESFD
jgi:translation initiation factor IF-2